MLKVRTHGTRLATIAGVVGALIAFAAAPTPVAAQSKIIGLMGFPCGLNDFARLLCEGFEEGASQLPEGYSFELKTGIDYADQTAFNNLIETSLLTGPAGIIVFPGGPAAQKPVLMKACEAGTKVIIIDNPVDGLGECQSGYIAADHYELGVKLGQWLLEHPAKTKEVGVVTQPPGQYASTDARIKGFTETVEAADYTVVGTVVTDGSLDQTRNIVTNLVSAHPNLGVVVSGNGIMGSGATQGVSDPSITQLTFDGFSDSISALLAGALRADALQDPKSMGRLAVENMAKLLGGEQIEPEIHTESSVLDAANVQAYVDATGMTVPGK